MLEKEITYYTTDDVDFIKVLSIIQERLNVQKDLRVKYNDRIEMRYTDKEVDKAKVTFKVNHGDIFWRQNLKKRVSGRFERIQLYQEKITEWKDLKFFDSVIITGDNVQALYYKERYKVNFLYNSEKICIIGQSIDFLDFSFETIEKRNYIEVEGNGVNKELDSKLFETLHILNFHKLDLENAKITLGNKALDGRNPFRAGTEEIQTLIWEIFKKKSIEKFQQ